MYFLIYVSSATQQFPKNELKTLLAQARQSNEQHGITGLLLYKDGNFMQILEGERPAVETTHAKITLDSRHRGLITLLKGDVPERDFTEWSMGFRDLKSLEASRVAGYSTFLNTPLTGKEFMDNPSNARKLLLIFKQSM